MCQISQTFLAAKLKTDEKTEKKKKNA